MKQDYDYINEFNRQAYDRITLIVPKGTKERIKEQAKKHGMNSSQYIVSLIPKWLIGLWRSEKIVE